MDGHIWADVQEAKATPVLQPVRVDIDAPVWQHVDAGSRPVVELLVQLPDRVFDRPLALFGCTSSASSLGTWSSLPIRSAVRPP